ncbi:MAG: glycosyltransferase [Bacteroidales bacterium]|nr:glycosyltransferase [Bacteroidales bacterium]
MKIGLQAFGTRGDVEPFLALSIGLKNAGHSVTIAITTPYFTDYSGYAEKYGIQVIHANNKKFIDQNVPFNLSDEEIATHILDLKEHYVYINAEKLCLENDIVIGLEGAYYLHTFAEIHKKPYITLSYQHSLIPSQHKPYMFHNDGSPLTPDKIYYSWKAVEEYINNEYSAHVNSFRNKAGLPPLNNLFKQVTHSEELHLIAVSRAFCTQYDEWGNHRYVCGHFNLGNILDARPLPEALTKFMEGNTPPLFLTLGSSNFSKQKHLNAYIKTIKAANALGLKLIIQAGKTFSNELNELITDNVFLLNEIVDYTKLLPKCSMAIHHGGAGTTHIFLSCGIPCLILESGADTPVWAYELKRLGVAPERILLDEATEENIAEGIRQVTNSKQMKENALQINNIIRSENGVKTAVEIINSKYC